MACREDGRDCEEYVGLHVGVIETRILLVSWDVETDVRIV